MKTNNYDRSSTGTDIEFFGEYDSCLARHLWEENFQDLKDGKYYYINNGNLPGADSISLTITGTVKNLKKWLKENCGRYYEYSEINDMKKADLIESVLDTLRFSDSITVLTYQDINDYQLKDSGLELVPNKSLNWIAIHGYSQGDYAEICYCPDDLGKVNESSLRKEFTHYFFDAPVYARFEINGKEYNYHEMPIYDEYDWQPEKFAEYVSKESGVDKETLMTMLPQYL
jgi:hypothetical protein